MRIDLSRLAPLGLDGKKEGQWIVTGWVLAGLMAAIEFSNQYTDALARLYLYGGSIKLIPGAVMTEFSLLVMGCEFGFVLLGLALGLLAVYHYSYHSQGSKPVYLMRRLPKPWELHIRCLGMPLAGIAGGLALLGLECVLFYCVYRSCTPVQCLPG